MLDFREARYVVLKVSDIVAHLDADALSGLMKALQAVDDGRKGAGKAPLSAVVVESDWPEYEPTWAAIQARMTGAQADERTCLVPSRLVDLFCNALDNLGDLPISEEWAAKFCREGEALLEANDYFRAAARAGD